MKEFVNEIKKQNKHRTGWIVLWVLGLIMFTLKTSRSTRLRPGSVNIILASILILTAAIDYVCRYFYIYKDGSEHKKWGLLFRYAYEKPYRLSDILKSHSFNVDAYTGIILRRLLPLQFISVAALLTLGLSKIIRVSDSLIASAICLLVPIMVIFSTGMITKYNLTHQRGRALIFLAALSGIYNLVKAAVAVIAAFKVSILTTAICSSNIIMKGISNDTVARVSSNSDKYVGTAILSFVLAVFLVLDGNFHITSAVKRHMASVLLVAIFAFSVIMFTYTAKNNNVTLYADDEEYSFCVNSDSKLTSYNLDSVKSFRVFEEDNSIQIEITAKSDTSFKLFADSMDDTEAWSDKYHSDYNYAADLCRKLTEKGAEGKLEETDKLKKIIRDKDSETVEGFNELVTIIEGAGK